MNISPKTPEIIAKYYEYLLWLMQRILKFPRNQKYTFGKKIEEKALEILEELIEAYYQHNKLKTLSQINLNLEILRYLIRLAKDLDLFSIKQFKFSANNLEEIGKQLGGWIKQQGRYEENR